MRILHHAATVSLFIVVLTFTATAAERPDVLFIAVEDVSPQRMGCWGNTICKTPNIDRLAAQSLRFDQAHCNIGICNASRTTLLTCLRPHTTKIYGNTLNWAETVPQAQSMIERFRVRGYETVRIGKIFHGGLDHTPSWTRVIEANADLPPAAKPTKSPKGPGVEYLRLLRAGKTKKTGSPFMWGPTGRDDTDELDGRVATQAVRVLNSERDQPLLLAIGLHAPHLPFLAPDKYFAMYPPESIPLPELPTDDREKRAHFDHKSLSEATWREAIAAQYACVSFADAQVGRIMQALKESGREDNTIVVLWSDHGYVLGEHYQWRKPRMYDVGTRVALLMRAPGVTTAGSVCERPVESIDIFPTLFELCDISQPSGIEAISMKRLLGNPAAPWRKGAVINQRYYDSIRTERFRFTNYHKTGRVELFDYDIDPNEMVNLAGDPKYAKHQTRLKQLLYADWQEQLPQ